jgi:hypothetical protein
MRVTNSVMDMVTTPAQTMQLALDTPGQRAPHVTSSVELRELLMCSKRPKAAFDSWMAALRRTASAELARGPAPSAGVLVEV